MSDNNPISDYQEILDKYAADLQANAKTISDTPDLSLPSTPKIEADIQPEIKPETYSEFQPELSAPPPEIQIAPPPEIQTLPQAEVQTVPEPEPQIFSQPEIQTTPQIELPSVPEPQNFPQPTPPSLSYPETETFIPPPPHNIEIAPDYIPPKENNLFKYLFFFSLLVFIIVLVSVALAVFNSQKSLPALESIPTSSLSPTTAPASVCEINDQSYPVGQTFTATDGCNTCTCNADLTIVCTEKACTSTPTKSATTSAIPKDWKIYLNNDFEFSIKYPPTWKNETDQSTIQNGNREFRFKTANNEFVSGIVFDRPANNSSNQTWSKEINLKNNKSILITYTDNLGSGSKGGTIDIDIFDQILSTFKLL